MKRLAVLVSGNGSNMQSIIDAANNGILKGLAEVVLVISNSPSSYALKRAENENIKTTCIERKKFENEKSFNYAILKELQNVKTDIVCLAGYIRIVGQDITNAYHKRILNIHPALLPKFGGKGMYGRHIHEAVIKSKEKKSGATVHFADEDYDTGEIIIQQEVEIFENDTPQDMADRILNVEHQIYPKAIKKVIENLK
ncbi:MAG: phosphoribosylglycinamide formyltransferase [Endomicrobium sp.]|jgi:phosphoribosylglycinamide formyltransferase-1|nr:phosphoribosylglycinamide formyltransferase [Endomicrobium sp.]